MSWRIQSSQIQEMRAFQLKNLLKNSFVEFTIYLREIGRELRVLKSLHALQSIKV